MECILSIKSSDDNLLQRLLEKNLKNIQSSKSLILNIRYRVQLKKEQYERINSFLSASQCSENVRKLSLVIEGQNNITADESQQLGLLLSGFKQLKEIKIQLWRNCGISEQCFSSLIQVCKGVSSLQKLSLNIEQNQILNGNGLAASVMQINQLLELDLSQINFNNINEQYNRHLFKCISEMTQLENISFSFAFSTTDETQLDICQSLRKLTKIKYLHIRIIQDEPVVINEKLFKSISEGMTLLSKLQMTFDYFYIQLPNQNHYLQQLTNLTYLKVSVMSYKRTSLRQLNLLIDCVAQLNHIEDFDLLVVSSNYNLFSQELNGVWKLHNLKSFRLRLELSLFYDEQQFIQFLEDLFTLENMDVIEIFSNACLLTKRQNFNIRYPKVLSLMYTNGTDLLELLDNNEYFKNNKQLILNSIVFKEHLSSILYNNAYQTLFDLYID